MDEDSPVIYGLEFQARALCPQHGDSDVVRFLAGTQSLRYDNQVHIVDFDDETKIINKHVLGHSAGEIWHINSSPSDKSIISTCYNQIVETKAELRAALWQIPPLDDTEPPTNGEDIRSDLSLSTQQTASLKKLCDLNNSTQNVRSVLWNPHGDGNRLIALAEHEVNIWSLDSSTGTAEVTCTLTLEGKSHPKFNAGKFSPHHGGSQVATAYENSIKGWDLRSMRSTYCIENAHSQTVRDLDFNPNRQYFLATCSDDCKVKFWDTRNVTSPLMTRGDHSHWVWSVRYNHFHDQLVLTSGSDSRVVLSSIASLSSEPFGHYDDEDDVEGMEKKREPAEDSVIARFDEHEDSVYAVEWSTSDPWIFASLSYDGRLVINRVPRAEKYKILL